MQKILFSLIIGFLLGLMTAAGVSFYINNAKIPLVDRFNDREAVNVPPNWNPNASLQPSSTTVTTPPPSLRDTTTTSSGNVTPDTDPAAVATNGNLPAPTMPEQTTGSTQLYVQAGALPSMQEAEQRRASLALIGAQATISQTSAGGRTFYRVRIGPYNNRGDAQAAVQRLASSGIESTIVTP